MVCEAIVARVVLWVFFSSYSFMEEKGLFIVEQMSQTS